MHAWYVHPYMCIAFTASYIAMQVLHGAVLKSTIMSRAILKTQASYLAVIMMAIVEL